MEQFDALKTQLAEHEARLQFAAFSNADALQVGLAIVRHAEREGKSVTLAIERNGVLLFAHAMDGRSADNAAWLARKVRVVQRYGHSSYFMGVAYRARGTTFEEHTGLDPQRYAAKGGAFPLLLKGTGMVGSVAVSGLSEDEDHALVVGALTELLAAQASV